MSEYGIIVKDTSANTLKLTPDIANVVASGTLTMPSALVDTNKYYGSIDLPGTDAIAIANVASIFNVFLLAVKVTATLAESDAGYYMLNFFADDAFTYYTKNLSTGVMTSWTPGDLSDMTDASKCDGLFSAYPIAYWESLGASTITDVKVFAAMMYHIYDGGDSAFKDAYTIYTNGVEKVEYVVTMRRKVTE